MKMKKVLPLLLAILSVAACLTGCGKDSGKPKTIDLAKLSQAIDGGSLFDDTLGPLDQATALSLFGLQSTDVVKCVVSVSSTGATPEEYALFQATDAAAAGRVAQAANDRVTMQKTVYYSYAPEQLPTLDGAIVRQSDVYVVYICASDAAAAQTILDKYIPLPKS